MKIFRNILMKSVLFTFRPKMLKYYLMLRSMEYQSLEYLVWSQEEKLREFIPYINKDVEYYKELFLNNRINPVEIKNIKDLEKIPLLDKKIIKSRTDDFYCRHINKIPHFNHRTGGSTGIPLEYKMSLSDYYLGIIVRLFNWGFAGYEFGDKVFVIAGYSLIPDIKYEINQKLKNFAFNTKMFSSYQLSHSKLDEVYLKLIKQKPNFIWGYPSSLYILAKFFQDNNYSLSYTIKGIFTTSERLLSFQRRKLMEVFQTQVFDTWGLNDGGGSAYECEFHKGMHVDMVRSILEVLDENKKQVTEGEGEIYLTGLYNIAMPFLRYNTGDIAKITYKKCKCGRESPRILEIMGREADILNLNDIQIGGPILTILMGKLSIEQYQIIQTGPRDLIIRMVKSKFYITEKSENFIRETFQKNVGSLNIKFEYPDIIHTEVGQKYKFIINKYNGK